MGNTDRKQQLTRLWEREHHICYLCGREISRSQASREHPVSKAAGDGKRRGQPRLACLSCNGRKGPLTLEQYRELEALAERDKHGNITKWPHAALDAKHRDVQAAYHERMRKEPIGPARAPKRKWPRPDVRGPDPWLLDFDGITYRQRLIEDPPTILKPSHSSATSQRKDLNG